MLPEEEVESRKSKVESRKSKVGTNDRRVAMEGRKEAPETALPAWLSWAGSEIRNFWN
jgi:hypothetical protein